MASWTSQSTAPHRVFKRRLGLTELGFYWDGAFSGTADTLQHALVSVHPARVDDVLNPENIRKTWTHLKQQFPLLGCQLEVHLDAVYYVVFEDRLASHVQGEISYHTVSSLQEAQKFTRNAVAGERMLSDTQPARLFILNRSDRPNCFHVLLHLAHCITDGISNSILLREFMNVMSLSHTPGPLAPLEARLALAVASESLKPGARRKIPQQRWHFAIGRILAANRIKKTQGGHTLPRRFTPATNCTPASSGFTVTSFPEDESIAIIKNCRKHGLTFGNAFPVLGQVALARVLCRRFLRGEITLPEWEFRRREPMTTSSPINLRPFLDSQWLRSGGENSVGVAVGFWAFTLPFMPLGLASNLAPGDSMPTFRTLLSPDRFLLRCNIVKRQSTGLMEHPFFLEMLEGRLPERARRVKDTFLNYRRHISSGNLNVDDRPIPVSEQAKNNLVATHGGSSFGNVRNYQGSTVTVDSDVQRQVDQLIPRAYPLSNKTEPFVHLELSGVILRCRPGELYLGASTSRKQLHMSIFWDKNVYEEGVVDEWLHEVRSAAETYLLQPP
ncbi:hypothetical protein BD779DRAFT_1389516, partial [Infundibulicybe gibba]